MKKWEYKAMYFNEKEFCDNEILEKELNALGTEGWEVVNFCQIELMDEIFFKVIFKKEKQD